MTLREVGDELWMAEGPEVSFYGFPYPTRMVIARLDDGTLWVWSPVSLDEELERETAALGPVRHLISPNKLHHLFLGAWKERWPEARLYASPGLAKRRQDLSFDAELADEPDPAWAGQIDQVVVWGSVFVDEVLFFHRRSSTCLVCDLVQRLDAATQKGWRGALMKLNGLVGPGGSTPRDFRATFLRRRRARAAAETALAWEPEQLIIAHGECTFGSGGADSLHRGLAWLEPSTDA